MEDNNVNATTQQEEINQQAEVAAESNEDLIARLMAENKRLKKASDKNASDASSWKKKYMDTQDEAGRLKLEKAEKDAALLEELETLRKETAITKLAKSFLSLGYSEDQAQRAAEAQYAGDADELIRIQRKYQDDLTKTIRADIMRSMPAPSIVNDEGVQMTQEQFDKMSYLEQVKLRREHPKTYEAFANNY